MHTSLHYRMAGLGAASSGAQTAVALGTTAAQAVVPTAVGSTVAGILGITTAAAIPIVGAAIAGISVAIEAILNSGCGQTCIETSQWANQAETYLQQNIAEYFAVQAPRPQSVQQLAMANFKAIWNQLVQLCSQPSTGTAGQRCISDRQDGACTLKSTGQQYPGGPAPGTCWNWWNGYYYPIANDPNVDTSSGGILSGTGLTSTSLTPVLLIGGAALALYMVMS